MKCNCKFEKGNWSCTCGAGAREIATKKLSELPAKEIYDRLVGEKRQVLGKMEGWHAWWSKKNDHRLGHVNVYLDANGREVEITEVTKNPDPCWNDAEYRGIVVSFGRQRKK